ncbi:hypothetical protein HNR74_000074 [Flammeovirga kamogawensis]|nr:hypothetical protein [Flammeovirga kamogawensis]
MAKKAASVATNNIESSEKKRNIFFMMNSR